MSRSLNIDFEFNRIVEPKVNLVCACTYDEKTGEKIKWWLHNSPREQEDLKEYLEKYDEIIAYSAIAECRSLLAMDIDPLGFEWVDLFIEYRMMTNHNDDLSFGKQLVEGKVKFVKKPKPKWERSEEDEQTGFRPTHSLAEATYKLTGVIRDTEHKTRMRNLIISDPEEFTAEEREAIMDYCMEDVEDLPNIKKRLVSEFFTLVPDYDKKQFIEERHWRGRYSAHTSLMENKGYPIDFAKTKNFSRQVGNILFDLQREINQLFPDIKPFRWNKKENRFSWDQKKTKIWVKENHDAKKWKKTDSGDISLALEAFEKVYQFKHDYPKDSFGAQMVRFGKMKQSLYGFVPTSDNKKKKTFWDSVGSDNRVRPYMNIYGAQSGRSQPGATGFMFLKPAWMRALVQPAPGNFMAGIDYGQQEFFVAALESGDLNMLNAYLSGDPYLYGAKLAGAIPQDGTKESHKLVRDIFKNTYLGILFGMTKYGLSVKLTGDIGRYVSEDEAQHQIDLFEEAFPDYMEWKNNIADSYGQGSMVRLPCGWIMWGDNDNIRSVMNVPVQGFGASVMRKAVDLAHAHGIYIAFTLHDALYMEDKIGNEYKIAILRDCMREAFKFYFPDKVKPLAARIKLDPFAWSSDYEKDSEMIVGKSKYKIPVSDLYMDERAETDYKRFSQYFNPRIEDTL